MIRRVDTATLLEIEQGSTTVQLSARETSARALAHTASAIGERSVQWASSLEALLDSANSLPVPSITRVDTATLNSLEAGQELDTPTRSGYVVKAAQAALLASERWGEWALGTCARRLSAARVEVYPEQRQPGIADI